MASNQLTPVQLAEIRERVPANPLLAALDAANAENERLRKALREIDSNRGGEANTAYALHRKLIQSANIARTAMEPRP